MKNRLLATLVTVALILTLVVSANAASETNPNLGAGLYPGTSEPGVITVDCATMSKLNPILMTYGTELSMARHLWDAPVKLDVDNNVIPGAAESWTVSDDSLTWTFKIRQGMKWVNSKGEVVADVTAKDFEFGIKELLNPEVAAEYYYMASIFANADAYYAYKSGTSEVVVEWDQVGVKALDDYTLELKLERVLPYFLQQIKFEVFAPIYEPFYTEVGAANYCTSPETGLYTGAFYMTEWVLENKVVTVKNPYWYDAANVTLEGVVYAKYVDTNARLNAFMGGEIDLIDLAGGEQRAIFEAEGFTVSSYVGGYSFYYLCNNTDVSDLRSPSLRKAISAAIDRWQFINTIRKDSSVPAACFTLGVSGVNTPNFSDAVVAANGGEPLYNPVADPELAKSYLPKALEELGYTDISQIKVVLMTSEGTLNEATSQLIQEQLRVNLGLDVGIEVLTITEARARRNAKNYDIFFTGWGPDYNDPMTDLDLWVTGGGNNHSGYSSAEYDALIEAAKVETDMVAREQLFVQMEMLLAEDMPIIPIFWRAEDYVVSEKMVSGYTRMPFQQINLFYTRLAD
ncbi:MAG TPA: peptide ABC transporter substrate-binding protein [Candidatus Limiplasma sp.]|nr:peptide ABC transporter substrate-binding protein [Candidatus Limiplasma sp.]HRX08159.1 peptide ABC transporter substrate-binding protein [Candidatus Limiplasma sp.]